MANSDKLVNLEDLGAAFDASLQKDFTQYDPAGQYTGNERIPLYLNGENYSTDMQTLLSSAGGGGSNQGAITDYKKVCGPISSLPWTSAADSNITADMYLSYATSSKPSVLSVFDWSTSNDGTVRISAKNGGGAVTLSESVTLTLYFSVGMSTAPSILTNLGSNTADNILKTAPRPGVYGTLGIANGGTNASSASAARTNLDVYSKSETDTAIAQSAVNFEHIAHTIAEFNAIISEMSSPERTTVFLSNTVINALTGQSANGTALMSKMDDDTVDMIIYSLGGNYIGAVRYSRATQSVSKELPVYQRYTDVQITTGDTQYQGYYYGDITLSTISDDRIRSVVVYTVTNNRPAFAIRIGASHYRVYTTVSGTVVTLRVFYV